MKFIISVNGKDVGESNSAQDAIQLMKESLNEKINPLQNVDDYIERAKRINQQRNEFMKPYIVAFINLINEYQDYKEKNGISDEQEIRKFIVDLKKKWKQIKKLDREYAQSFLKTYPQFKLFCKTLEKIK